MPPVRSPVKCRNPVLKTLKGILYAHDAEQASTVQVPTIIHSTSDSLNNPRFPSFEAILGVEAWTHETWVKVHDTAGVEHCFLIAAQYRTDCGLNASLQAVHGEASWKGGLVVMCKGKYASVVEMGGAHFKKLVESAVRRFLIGTAHAVHDLVEASHNSPAGIIPAQI